jgi:hypothetical protein
MVEFRFACHFLGDNLPALAQNTHLQSLRAEAVKNAIEAQREPTSQWRNIESSLPRYTKERFAPSQYGLSNAVLGQFGHSLSTCDAEKIVAFRRLTIPMRFAVCVDSSYAASM